MYCSTNQSIIILKAKSLINPTGPALHNFSKEFYISFFYTTMKFIPN